MGDFWGRFRNEDTQSALFRYEHDGIVVYDSHARQVDDKSVGFNLESNVFPKRLQREIELAYDKSQYLQMKAYPPFKPSIYEYTLVAPSESTLKFDSRFESGNLSKAIKVTENEYNLLLEFDTETSGFTQWFYFSVENYKPHHRVRFNIINLTKFESLYNNGLKPLVYSSVLHKGWERKGKSISYFKNNIMRPSKKAYYYTLTFTYTFKAPSDKVFFAHCYPYTYSDLKTYLDTLRERESLIKINSLCKTLAGNDCYALTITQNAHTYAIDEEELKLHKSAAGRRMIRLREQREKVKMKILEKTKHKKPVEDEHKNKKVVILTARVHPGESNSSYMMKGAVDFLLGDSKDAKILRKHFIFKVIPMINPDGVVYGNYRCSLLGVDLNRRWKNPNIHMHPTVFYAKKLVQTMKEDFDVVMYCDMHGHSMKKNVFMYACAHKGFDLDDIKANLLIKLIPFYLGRMNKQFVFKDCHFRNEKYKESTARIVCFKEFGILNSLTLEASFYGVEDSSSHISKGELENMGRDVNRQLMMYLNPGLLKWRINYLINYFRRKNRLRTKESDPRDENEHEEFEGELHEEENIAFQDFNDVMNGINDEDLEDLEFSAENSDSCGSDSSASEERYPEPVIEVRPTKKDRKKVYSYTSFEEPSKLIEPIRVNNRCNSRSDFYRTPPQKLSPVLSTPYKLEDSTKVKNTIEPNAMLPLKIKKREERNGFIISSIELQNKSTRSNAKSRYKMLMEELRKGARPQKKKAKQMFVVASKIERPT